MYGCDKELSYEYTYQPPPNDAEGTLKGAPGDCAAFTVYGWYAQGTALDTSNRVSVEASFTKKGAYFITTDTVNGCFFIAMGTTLASGTDTIRFRGYGTPLNPGDYTFKINFKGSTCTFPVTVYPTAAATSGDYFPTTTGSWWTYFSDAPSAAPKDTFLNTVTADSIRPAGASAAYKRFVSDAGGILDTAYYRKDAGNYIQYGNRDLLKLTDFPLNGEWVFLNDRLLPGTEWQSPVIPALIGGRQSAVRLQHVLRQVNIRIRIENKVYINTIVVETAQQIQQTPGGPFATAFSYLSYYAKGIGLVKVEAPAPVYGFHVLKYQVK